jgi:hypothetical protein
MLMVKSDERSGIVRKRITLLDEYTALHQLPLVSMDGGTLPPVSMECVGALPEIH